MTIDNNEQALATMRNVMVSFENRFRSVYNFGYKDGYKDGADAVFHDILEKIISEKNIGGKGGDDE